MEDNKKNSQVAGTTSENNTLNEIVINELRGQCGLKPIANGDTPLKKMD